MMFEEIVDQAAAMLARRGRVTYRVLQRQFALDDAALADLKEELLFSYPQVTEEDGRGLVWGGAAPVASAESPVPSAPQPPTPSTQPPISYTPPHLAERIRASSSWKVVTTASARPSRRCLPISKARRR